MCAGQWDKGSAGQGQGNFVLNRSHGPGENFFKKIGLSLWKTL